MSEHLKLGHAHVFGGLGGGAAGFNDSAEVADGVKVQWECVGSIDNDPAACEDFYRLVGVRQTCLDLFSRDQYRMFHGCEPPDDWEEVTVERFRSCYSRAPNLWLMSSPCKGNSGLLSEAKASTAPYQALNALALRGMMFSLEAFADDPAEFLLFENVPRIVQRSAHLLEQMMAMARHYGYLPRETQHDCGVIGGLGQTRKRYLQVSRHLGKVPNFIYEPPRRGLISVGEVLDKFPLPGDPRGGIMHRVPRLQFGTWVRLAFVPAGQDWRALGKLRVKDGLLQDYALAPEPAFNTAYGVTGWQQSANTISGDARPSKGKFAVADPRIDGHAKSVQHGVLDWNETAGVVTGKMFVGGGAHAVADPRPMGPDKFSHIYRVVPWTAGHAPAVSGANAGTAAAVADPRPPLRADYNPIKYKVTRYEDASGAVIAASTTGNGAFAVADPRMACLNDAKTAYRTGGHFGVVPWEGTSRAIPGFAKHNNGQWNVADPRIDHLPPARQQLVCIIRALDGTWHRPFTTLELAALQSLVEPQEFMELYGKSDSAWRERIGNAIPRRAAKAMAGTFGRAIVAARKGVQFQLSAEPVWVRPIAIALQVAGP